MNMTDIGEETKSSKICFFFSHLNIFKTGKHIFSLILCIQEISINFELQFIFLFLNGAIILSIYASVNHKNIFWDL